MEQSPVSLGRSKGLASRKTSETSSWTEAVEVDGPDMLLKLSGGAYKKKKLLL